MWLILPCFGGAAEAGRYARTGFRGSVLAILTLFFGPFGAFAQAVPAAEALFNRGVADFQAGRYEQACQELADSYRLEALPGVLFTLATCEARAGRVASSAAHYQDFLQLVSRLPVEQRALQRERELVALAERRALLPSVPTLTVWVDGGLPDGAAVHCDGALLGPSLLGRALPLDPGVHVLSLTLSDGRRSERRVSLALSAHERVALNVPTPEIVRVDEVSTSSTGWSVRPWMMAGGVASGVGFVAGGVLGGLAWKQKGVVDEHCQKTACDTRGSDAADRGRIMAHASTAAFGLGVAGLVTMLVVHLRHKKAERPGLESLTISPRGVAFGARF
jgi:hypothetical protein